VLVSSRPTLKASAIFSSRQANGFLIGGLKAKGAAFSGIAAGRDKAPNAR